MKIFTPEDASLDFSETYKPRVAYTYRRNINQATCLN